MIISFQVNQLKNKWLQVCMYSFMYIVRIIKHNLLKEHEHITPERTMTNITKYGAICYGPLSDRMDWI